MEISRKSRWYKLARFWKPWRDPNSLCELVRWAVFGAVKWVGIGVGGVVMIAGAIVVVGTLLFIVLATMWHVIALTYSLPSFISPGDVAAHVLGMLWWTALLIGLIVRLYIEVHDRRRHSYCTREPSVLTQYVKARTNKLCPMITIKD